MNRTKDELEDDIPEWTEADFAVAKRASEIPELADLVRKGRGPQKRPTKRPMSIRLSPEVLDFFQGQGDGWQRKIDDALKDYVKRHRKAA